MAHRKSSFGSSSPRSVTVSIRFPLFFFALLLCFSLAARAQDTDSTDRIYKHRKAEVEEALQSLKAYETNRLPVLDGFVNANATTIAKLENPHYQLRIEVESQGPTQTLVSVIAKITAWSAEADPSRSQYVVVPSNGRLEQDILDRLSVFLEKGNVDPTGGTSAPAGSASSSAATGPPSSAPNTDRSAPVAADSADSSASPTPTVPARGSPASSSHSPVREPSYGGSSAGSDPASPVAGSGSVPHANPADPSALAGEIASVQAQRQASEMNQRKIQQQISELEANASSQKFLSNLAVIKTPQTPVFQQDDDTSKVLFRADPEDEFEVINVKESWFHVRLENGAEGWIRAAQLQPPQEVDDAKMQPRLSTSRRPTRKSRPSPASGRP